MTPTLSPEQKDFKMKIFTLERQEDISGVSGTGVVAVGIIFPNGWCALSWFGEHQSIGIYPGIETLKAIHGHNGATVIRQIVDYDEKNVRNLRENDMLDEIESIVLNFRTDTQKYVWEERRKLVDIFHNGKTL
jgi:hypothetical protein